MLAGLDVLRYRDRELLRQELGGVVVHVNDVHKDGARSGQGGLPEIHSSSDNAGFRVSGRGWGGVSFLLGSLKGLCAKF